MYLNIKPNNARNSYLQIFLDEASSSNGIMPENIHLTLCNEFDLKKLVGCLSWRGMDGNITRSVEPQTRCLLLAYFMP